MDTWSNGVEDGGEIADQEQVTTDDAMWYMNYYDNMNVDWRDTNFAFPFSPFCMYY